jgi:alkylated DNA repair protein (DNA oxidative demethylase)
VRTLFDPETLPAGLIYQDDFLTAEEERTLLDAIHQLEFHEMRMRGVAARRRIVDYGWKYSFESFKLSEGPAMPEFLGAVRNRCAAFAALEPDALSEALVTEYTPGATIGWHRDAPPFDVVIGVSLASPARFRFRRGKTRAWEIAETVVRPRSIYVLTGPARTEWEHSIPAVSETRYSITFRSLRRTSA